MPKDSWMAPFVLGALILTAGDQAWKNKQFSEWTEDDAKEVLKDSPWVKTVAATVINPPVSAARVHSRGKQSGPKGAPLPPPILTLRWESALPVREAELKARDTGAPSVDVDHYAIALYGISRSLLKDNSKVVVEEIKKQAVLKRDGKKDIKPSSVELLLREDGPVVVYRFPKSAEFTWRDHRIDFAGKVANLKFSQEFSTDDMTVHGKLEL